MSVNRSGDTRKGQGFLELIDFGFELVGDVAKSALSFFAGDPICAMALGAGGAVAAKMLKRIGQEVSERLLSPREKVRVGAVLAIAAAEIKQRIENGECLRSDGFFDEKPSGDLMLKR